MSKIKNAVEETVSVEEVIKSAQEIIDCAIALGKSLDEDDEMVLTLDEKSIVDKFVTNVKNRDVILRMSADLESLERRYVSRYIFVAGEIDEAISSDCLVAAGAIAVIESAIQENETGNPDHISNLVARNSIDLALDVNPDHSLGGLLNRMFAHNVPTRVFLDSILSLSAEDCAKGAA